MTCVTREAGDGAEVTRASRPVSRSADAASATSADEADARVPEREQVVGCHPAAGAVVVRDGVGAGEHRAAAGDHDGHARGDREVGVGLAGDDDALDAQWTGNLDGGDVEPGGVEEAIGDHEPVPLVLQCLAQSREQVDEPLVRKSSSTTPIVRLRVPARETAAVLGR